VTDNTVKTTSAESLCYTLHQCSIKYSLEFI